MGRPKNPEGRCRSVKFSIVIHDVLPIDKDRISDYAKSLEPTWFLVALEEYGPDVPVKKTDHHLHLFIQHLNSRSKFEHLKKLQEMFPESRVQVDHGKGCFEDCHKYLTNPGKDKHIDTDVICDDRPMKVRHHTTMHAKSKICRRTCSRCAYLRWHQIQLDKDIMFRDQRPYMDPIGSKLPANKIWV